MKEHAELAEKMDKLSRFLFAGTSVVLSLPVEEQHRLKRQYAYMKLYLEVLTERIEAFSVAESTSAADGPCVSEKEA